MSEPQQQKKTRTSTFLMLRSNLKKLAFNSIMKLRFFYHREQITEEEFFILRRLRIKEKNRLAQQKSRFNKRKKAELTSKKAKTQDEPVQRLSSTEVVADILISMKNKTEE